MDKMQTSSYRQALGTFATGVTVVTAASSNGELAGVTANSFTSVSLNPPLILWCLDSKSDSLTTFQSAEYFAVNILASDQKSLSSHFAKRQEDKFKTVNYQSGRGRAPILQDCTTYLQCKNNEQYEIGDHWVFVGEVMEFETQTKEALLFHLGSYGTSLPLPSDESSVISSINEPESHDDSLFSLLLQAIHAYQLEFESRQKKIIESSYEARIITILHKYSELNVNDICQMIQMPKEDTRDVLNELNSRNLVTFQVGNGEENFKLSDKGNMISDELIALAKQHDNDVYALFGRCSAEDFRENLTRIINWAMHD
jgi:flavin reductase (DIM6/NTAB) family NADH-FMN oxidoreductase RutF/DNA-binding MarR family transcriptional regulator